MTMPTVVVDVTIDEESFQLFPEKVDGDEME